jgi:hypothetical protein
MPPRALQTVRPLALAVPNLSPSMHSMQCHHGSDSAAAALQCTDPMWLEYTALQPAITGCNRKSYETHSKLHARRRADWWGI